jgi:20S proteasome subunit alpha 6
VHESNQNRFRIYFESPPELDRVPKALRRNPNKRWRRASSSVAPSVQDGQGKDVSAATATLEDVGEEKAAEQKEETEEVKEEVTVKEEEEATEDAEVAKTESTLAEDIPKTEPEVDAPTSEHHVESAGDNAAVEEQAPVEPALSQELSASTHVVPQENVKPPADEHAGLDEAADISMVTDAGAVAAAINDLVDAADDAADNDPSRNKPTIVESEQPLPSTDAPKIKLQGIHSLPPKPQLSPVTASQQTATKPAASETKPDDVASTLAASAENTASAYRSRTRRRSSVSSQGSVDEIVPGTDVPTPSTNRVSILYEGSQRRLCIDASVVETVRVHRAEGRIEMVLHPFDKGVEGKDLPKGILVSDSETLVRVEAHARSRRMILSISGSQQRARINWRKCATKARLLPCLRCICRLRQNPSS